MTARSAPQVLSSRIRERQTAASTASMPNPRPWRRGQAPKPHRGAPKAQGLTAAIAVAGPSPVPSIAPDDPVSLNSTGADVPMCAFAISRIYTSLTGTTAERATWPLTTCTRALRHYLRTSSDERHQNRPYSDQTKRHPGSGDISAHRSSPSQPEDAAAHCGDPVCGAVY